jgi:hypothetical protein
MSAYHKRVLSPHWMSLSSGSGVQVRVLLISSYIEAASLTRSAQDEQLHLTCVIPYCSIEQQEFACRSLLAPGLALQWNELAASSAGLMHDGNAASAELPLLDTVAVQAFCALSTMLKSISRGAALQASWQRCFTSSAARPGDH